MIETKEKKTSKIGWFLFGAALTVGGFIVIPPLLQKYSNKISKATSTAKDIDFENLGPIIEKKEDATEEDTNEC